jgi:hypothetical protein
MGGAGRMEEGSPTIASGGLLRYNGCGLEGARVPTDQYDRSGGSHRDYHG